LNKGEEKEKGGRKMDTAASAFAAVREFGQLFGAHRLAEESGAAKMIRRR